MTRPVLIESTGDLAIVRLDRAPANAIDLPTAIALRDALVAVREDTTRSALLLTGTGDCFCGGLDLKTVPSYTQSEREHLMQTLGEVVLELYTFPRPSVAALNGHAVAAGSLFTLCTDYRIAPDTECRFGFTGARVGMAYPEPAMMVIRAELSAPVARRLLLSARTFDQDAALRDGIVDELVPRAGLQQRAVDRATDLAAIPASDYLAVKQQIRGETARRLNEIVTRERGSVGGTWVAASDS